MKDLRFYDIKFQQLRIFYEAAKYESFTKAADHMFTTQPIISKSIANLENELGFKLFIRHPRKITLTSPGKMIYEYCIKLFALTEIYISKAENEVDRKSNCIVIGNDPKTDYDSYLFPIIRRFKKKFPNIQVEIELLDLNPSIEGVTNGSIDVSFIMLCNVQNLDGLFLDWKVIKKCNHVAFIPKEFSIFQRESITLKDVLELPLIITAPTVNLNYYNKTMGIFYNHGITPNIRALVKSNTTMLFCLHQGDGMVITNEFMENRNNPKIVPYPLLDTKDGLVAFWRKNEYNPMVHEFVKTAYETMNL